MSSNLSDVGRGQRSAWEATLHGSCDVLEPTSDHYESIILISHPKASNPQGCVLAIKKER